MPKSNKIFLIVAGCIIALVIVYGSFFKKPDEAGGQGAVYAEVERRNIENLVTATGTLEASQEVEIGFTVSGIVSAVSFEVGDAVKAGQIIAALAPNEYESQLNLNLATQKSIAADRRSAEHNLNTAKAELSRTQQLVSRGAASQTALETAELNLKNAQIALEKLSIELEKTQLNIDRDRNNLSSLKLVAPFDGVVTAQPFQIGQTVSANDNSKARLSNLEKLINRAQVAEADIVKIKDGMEAYLTTLGRPNERILARVVRIEPTPAPDSELVTYNVLLEIDNTEFELFDGMTTQVFFVLEAAEDVLAIPARALQTENGKSTVEVEGRIGKVDVQPGTRDRLYVEIKSGLNEGDRVLLGGADEGARGRRRGG